MIRRAFAALLVSIVGVSAQTTKPAAASPGGGEFRIAGVVYDATNRQTLPGARVSLGPTAGKGVVNQTVLTGPDGSFTFDHLAAGKYQIFGEAVGFPQQGFEQHEAPFLTGVVVGPDASADKLVFRLQRGCAISGTITDEFNDPVREARVMIFRKGLQEGRFNTIFSRTAQTDDQGFYKAAPLLPGTYYIAVTGRPWYARRPFETAQPEPNESMKRLDVAFPLTFYPGVTEANDAGEIVLGNGERATADISLHSLPAVQVFLHSSTRKLPQPQEGGTTSVSYEPGPFLRLTQMIFGEDEIGGVETEQHRSPEGYEIVSGIAPGKYIAHIGTPGVEGERTHELDITGDMTIDPDAFAGGSGTTSVQGMVQMSGGAAPPSGMYVMLEGRTPFNTQASEVDAKGEFSIERLQAGSYQVSITNTHDAYLLDMAATNAKVNGRSITVTGSAPVNLALVLGKGMAEIHGFAMRDAKGVGGTMVLLVPENPSSNYVLFRRDQSDSDGSFALARVVPGKYRVVAIDGGWDLEWSKAAVLKPYLEKAQQIEVAAGGKYDVKVQVQRAHP